jgi:hypothetical protein
MTEGTDLSLEFKLNSRPFFPVSIALNHYTTVPPEVLFRGDYGVDISWTPGSMIFNGSNWNDTQVVVVSALHDRIDEPIDSESHLVWYQVGCFHSFDSLTFTNLGKLSRPSIP